MILYRIEDKVLITIKIWTSFNHVDVFLNCENLLDLEQTIFKWLDVNRYIIVDLRGLFGCMMGVYLFSPVIPWDISFKYEFILDETLSLIWTHFF